MLDNAILPPGQVLKEQFMLHHGITQEALAKAVGVDRQRINAIIRGRRKITADTALRFSRYFGTSAEYWLALQAKEDLMLAKSDTALARACAKIDPIAVAVRPPKQHLKKVAAVSS